MVLRLARRLGVPIALPSCPDGGPDPGPPGRVRRSRLAVALGAFALDLTMWGGHTTLRGGGDVPAWAVVVAAAALFAVLARDRLPLPTAYGLAWGYTLAWGAILPAYQPFTALMLVLHDAARRLPARRTWPVLAGAVAPWALNTANVAALSAMSAPEVLVTAGLWAVMTGLVWMTGRVAYRTAQTIRLREEIFAARMDLARHEDRIVLARELHDVLSHSIGAITLQAAGARALKIPRDPRVDAALDAITATSTGAMRELRHLLGFLQTTDAGRAERAGEATRAAAAGSGDPASGPASGVTGVVHLRSLVATTRACGVRVHLHETGGAAPLPPSSDHLVYRIVQEGLANAMRHQGRGTRADVLLAWEPTTLTVTIDSVDGAGREAAVAGHGSGLGLRGIADRLAEAGGHLDAGPTPAGFRLVATLPR